MVARVKLALYNGLRHLTNALETDKSHANFTAYIRCCARVTYGKGIRLGSAQPANALGLSAPLSIICEKSSIREMLAWRAIHLGSLAPKCPKTVETPVPPW